MIDLSLPVVVNLALTGRVPRRADNPHVPITPDEIAADIDNLYMDPGKRTPASSLDLVRRVIGFACALGRPVATAEESRELRVLQH